MRFNMPATVTLLQAMETADRSAIVAALRAGGNPNISLDGFPLLTLSALNGDQALVKDLIRAGANINALDSHTGCSAVWQLAAHAETDAQMKILVRLIDLGANMNAQSPGVDGAPGLMPLEVAIEAKNLPTAMLLMDRGARCSKAMALNLKRLQRERSYQDRGR